MTSLRKRLSRAWFSVWRTEIDLTIVRWFAHRFGWHTNACRGCEACRPNFDARWRPNGWWSNRTRTLPLVECRCAEDQRDGRSDFTCPLHPTRVTPPAEGRA